MQAKHLEIIVVAISVLDDKAGVDELVTLQKLTKLHIAIGQDWQSKFGLTEAIPATVVLDGGRIRLRHESRLVDPVLELEADLAALHSAGAVAKAN